MWTTFAADSRISFMRGRYARRTRTRVSRELDVLPALTEPGVVTTLTQADVPGEGDSGANRHDEPLFPVEVLFYHQPVAWVLAESLEAARRGAARVEAAYAPLPAILTIEQAIESNSFLTDQLRIVDGDTRRSRSEPGARQGRVEDRRPGTFLPRDTGRDRVAGRIGMYRRALVDAASVGDTGDRGAGPRCAPQPGDRGVPAHGRRLRRQGSAGESVRRHCRTGCLEDEAPRPRQVDSRARHGDYGETPSLPRAIRGRLRARRPAQRHSHRAVLRRRLEPRPVGACDVAVDVSRRQHLQAAGCRGDRPRVPDAQNVADRVSGIWRAAGHAGRRRGARTGGASA